MPCPGSEVQGVHERPKLKAVWPWPTVATVVSASSPCHDLRVDFALRYGYDLNI